MRRAAVIVALAVAACGSGAEDDVDRCQRAISENVNTLISVHGHAAEGAAGYTVARELAIDEGRCPFMEEEDSSARSSGGDG